MGARLDVVRRLGQQLVGEVGERPGAGELVADLRGGLVARIALAVAGAADLGLVLDVENRVGEGVVALLLEAYANGPVLGANQVLLDG